MFAVWAPTEFRWRTVSIAAMLAWVSHVDSPKNLQPKLTTSQGLFRLNLILAFIVVILMLYFLSSECARVCVDTRRLCPLLSGSAFFPWGQDLSLNPKLGWWPASPNNSPTSFTPDPCTGVATTYIPDILCDFRRFELRSSCFYRKCCYPLSRLPSPSIPFRKTHSIILNYQCLLCH